MLTIFAPSSNEILSAVPSYPPAYNYLHFNTFSITCLIFLSLSLRHLLSGTSSAEKQDYYAESRIIVSIKD